MTIVLTFIVMQLSFWAVTEAFRSLSCEYVHNVDNYVKQASKRASALRIEFKKKDPVERGEAKIPYSFNK